MNELLQQLTEAVGVSGAEHEVRALIRDLIADHVDEWHVDTMGNLFALKKGTGESDLRVMVDAHMDEIGMLVTQIDRDGSLNFLNIGGINDRTLPGKVVQIGAKKIRGVIGLKAIHLSRTSERRSVPRADSLRIDIGASKKESVRKVNVGDRVAFVSEYREMGDIAMGKAFDDRAGCAVLVELLRGEPFPFDLHAVFSVQEEVGLRGAEVAAYAVKPDVALVLECTPALDIPYDEDVSTNLSLGQGPGVYVMDAYTFHDPRLVAHILKTGEKEGLPVQIRQPGGGGTNAGAIQRATGPTPTVTIGLPGRYAHTPNMMISLQDYANMVKLADASLRGLTRDVIQTD
ncbi:MAG TPA: M42 family metallopeptidase [Anaerolineae bacterium]|nr:M42 family metallopeptidase [Anaerolineae bacterium]